MAKTQKSNREVRKQKAEAAPKSKVPRYMAGEGISSAKPAPLKITTKK